VEYPFKIEEDGTDSGRKEDEGENKIGKGNSLGLNCTCLDTYTLLDGCKHL